MRNKNFTNTLILLFLFLFSAQCRSFNPFTQDNSNYFSSRFVCDANPGWRNSNDFNKYIDVIWAAVRLNYQLDNNSIKSAKTVITGNSLAHLFTPDLIERELPNKGVINRGIAGDMTETLLMRIEDDVISLRPQNIVIEIGGNDLIQGKCLSYSQNNVHKIISKIQTHLPDTRIIFLSVPPTDVPNLNAIVPIYNVFLASLRNQYSNIVYLETWPDMRDPDHPTIRRDLLREGLKDKLHFNEKGYSIWGKLLRPLL